MIENSVNSWSFTSFSSPLCFSPSVSRLQFQPNVVSVNIILSNFKQRNVMGEVFLSKSKADFSAVLYGKWSYWFRKDCNLKLWVLCFIKGCQFVHSCNVTTFNSFMWRFHLAQCIIFFRSLYFAYSISSCAGNALCLPTIQIPLRLLKNFLHFLFCGEKIYSVQSSISYYKSLTASVQKICITFVDVESLELFMPIKPFWVAYYSKRI